MDLKKKFFSRSNKLEENTYSESSNEPNVLEINEDLDEELYEEDYEYEDSDDDYDLDDIEENSNESRTITVENLDLRSDEVNEVLGSPPNWIIRSGIFLIFIATIVILVGACFLHYPDIVTTEVHIATQNLPSSVVSKKSGQITTLLVNENDTVVKGQSLAVIENLAKYNDVKYVEDWSHQFLKKLEDGDSIFTIDRTDLELGTLNSSFYDLQKSIRTYLFFLDQKLIDKKLNQLQSKIESKKKLLKNLKRRIALKRKTFALEKKKYDIDKRLFKKQIITEYDFDRSSESFLSAQLTINSIVEEETNQELELEELNFEMVELNDQKSQNVKDLKNAIHTTCINFLNELIAWKDTNILSAPIDGKLSFYKFWAVNQQVNTGDEVMVVLPVSENLFAYSYLPATNSGKVTVGQKVHIELKDFPKEQFGYVYGEVAYKSNISRDGKYLVRIGLPNDLRTKYRGKLKFSQEMVGNANIITQDLKLIERLYYKLINDFNITQNDI